MPSSKRQKLISLTKVKKAGRKHKEALVETIHECLDKYTHVYALSLENMRTSLLKDLRQKLTEDRFVMGKQNVMALALGRSPEEETKENLHQVTQHLNGTTALFFSSRPEEEVRSFFDKYQESDFAKGGVEAAQDFQIQAGPLAFQHTMVESLRKLGLPVMLRNGTVMCEKDHTVCKKGAVLTPEQAQVLKLLGEKHAVFKPELKCVWHDGTYTAFD